MNILWLFIHSTIFGLLDYFYIEILKSNDTVDILLHVIHSNPNRQEILWVLFLGLELQDNKTCTSPTLPAYLPTTGSSEVFNSKTCPCQTSTNLSIIVQVFFIPALVSMEVSLSSFCYGKPWFSASACLFVWGQRLALRPHISGWYRKSDWIFSLLSILLV